MLSNLYTIVTNYTVQVPYNSSQNIDTSTWISTSYLINIICTSVRKWL